MPPPNHDGLAAVIDHQHQAGTPDQPEGNSLVGLRKGHLPADSGRKAHAVGRFLGLHIRSHQKLPQMVGRSRQFQPVCHLVEQLTGHSGVSGIDEQGKHFQGNRHALRFIPAGGGGRQHVLHRQAGAHGPFKPVGKPAVLHFRESVAQNVQGGVRIPRAQVAAAAQNGGKQVHQCSGVDLHGPVVPAQPRNIGAQRPDQIQPPVDQLGGHVKKPSDHARERVACTSSTGIPAPPQAEPAFPGEMTIFSAPLSCNRSGVSIVLSNVPRLPNGSGPKYTNIITTWIF